MAFEEQAEVVQRRVENDVDEDATTGQVDADRQAVREVADGAALADARSRRAAGPRARCRSARSGGWPCPRRCRARPSPGPRRWRPGPSAAGWPGSAAGVVADGCRPGRWPRRATACSRGRAAPGCGGSRTSTRSQVGPAWRRTSASSARGRCGSSARTGAGRRRRRAASPSSGTAPGAR